MCAHTRVNIHTCVYIFREKRRKTSGEDYLGVSSQVIYIGRREGGASAERKRERESLNCKRILKQISHGTVGWIEEPPVRAMRTRARGRTKEGERKSDRGEERDARNESASSGGRPGCSAVFSLQLGGARERSRGVRAIALNFPFSRFSHPPAFARARTLPVCLLFLSLLAPSSLSQCVYIHARGLYVYTAQRKFHFFFLAISLPFSHPFSPSRFIRPTHAGV